ncbi:MAG: inorganic phosphate transporter [Cellvibrionaceae bacterium]|nr:inorganic phosphate transporter [Cellvibrionaceae bacterium]
MKDSTATLEGMHWLIRYGVSLAFLLLTLVYVLTISPGHGGYLLVFAAVVGAYMAMNIGANDVANNVGPAVGSQAMGLGAAIVLAAIFEAAGALIAGGDVVTTIKSGIISPESVEDTRTFVWLMTGALIAAAIWLNFATWQGAPVSTTHSIVGGVLGAGVAAGGMGIANWGNLTTIAASWVISPVMGGLVAAALLMFINKTVFYRDDVMGAAKVYVPWLVAFMAWAFSTYLLMKGTNNIWKPGFAMAGGLGLLVAAGIYFLTRSWVVKAATRMANNRDSVNNLFTIPLIFAAGLLSFAHGANDVANAIGPLAAIYDALNTGVIATNASIPLWVMLVGAGGLVVGLATFGPRLIRTVGGEITELDKSRAYCIAMSAAVTVIIASQLGLPVSSTHIALGGVFGVGFLREFLTTRYASKLHRILDHHDEEDQVQLRAYLRNFQMADVEEMQAMLKRAKRNPEEVPLTKKDRKRLKKIYRQELVKRNHLYRIAAAWVITVPASAVLGALMFYMLRGALL